MLFDEKIRNSLEPRSHIESDWEYLDRSGRIETQRVREFLTYWVTLYPESEQPELISRITGKDPKAFQSATFELILFAVLTSLGCKITVHPELSNGSSSRPDFHISTPDGEEVYVEAVIASEYSAAEIAAQTRTNIVLDAIEKLNSPYFFLGVNADGHPETPPSAKQIRHKVHQWLDSLARCGYSGNL